MACPTIVPINPPEIEAACQCRTGRVGRWVVFRWQVNAPGLTSFRTAVSIFDGTQWLTAPAIEGTSSEQQDRMFLTPGDYLWRVVTLDPAECAAEPLPKGDRFIIENCCSQVESLVGPLRVFSVSDGLPNLELTDQLNQTGCVTTDLVIVSMSRWGCPLTVEWLAPVSGDPTDPEITLPIALPPDGTPVTATARVSLAGCSAQDISLSVRQCPNNSTAPKPKWWCFGGGDCRFYEAMAIYPIIGMFFFFALALLVAVFAAGFLTFSMTGWTAVAGGVLMVFAAFLLGIGLGCALCVLIFTILWWWCCPPSPCRYYEDMEWALGWSLILCGLVPVGGWFYLPMQFAAFMILRPLMISNNCHFLQPLSLPHLR